MKQIVAGTIATCAAVASAAHADRYEAAIAVQPHGGVAWVREEGARESTRVPGGGATLRLSYGLRDWLAADAEVGGFALGSAQFEDVMVSIGGAPPRSETLTRTTRGARVMVGANLRLGVAWIPTIGVAFGGQLRMRGAATVAGSDLVPDGRDGTASIEPIAAVRAGLDRRLGARWVVGASVGVSRSFIAPAIGTTEATVSVSRYWYPTW